MQIALKSYKRNLILTSMAQSSSVRRMRPMVKGLRLLRAGRNTMESNEIAQSANYPDVVVGIGAARGGLAIP